MGRVQELTDEALSHVSIPRRSQQKIDCLALGIYRPLEVALRPFNPDLGRIDTVGIVGDAQVWSTPLVEFGGLMLDPAKHGRMIDGDASFPQEYCNTMIAQGIPQVPPHHAFGREESLIAGLQ
jgi:hypothetical protein